MLLRIPLQSVPNQKLQITLNKQTVTISIYLATNVLNSYMYCDVMCNGIGVVTGALCNNAVPINLYPTVFKGYLFFYNPNEKDPMYTDFTIDTLLLYSDYDIRPLISSKFMGELNNE